MNLTFLKELDGIENIYYRGNLDSCNYECSYCPFAKRDQRGIKEDEVKFKSFIESLRQSKSKEIRVMIIPYGEALIHNYYQEGMIEIAKMPNVIGISCQTNLSLSVINFVDRIRKERVNTSKIKLWASFHPEMVEIDTFLKSVDYFHDNGIELCVGSVGHPDNKEYISELRRKLNSEIYMFVNAMEGGGYKYSKDDVDFFNSIDPLFECDKKNIKADITTCNAGKNTFFIESDSVYACPRSGVKLSSKTQQDICKKLICDCYIAYSNMPNTRVHHFMGAGILWRIPEKRKVKAFFFDIDDTLTNNKGVVPRRYIEVLTKFSENVPLFLETALPQEAAKKKLLDFFDVFAGGVFADGAHINIGSYNNYIPISRPIKLQEDKYTLRKISKGDIVYKCAINTQSREETELLYSELNSDDYNILKEDKLLTFVDKFAGKKNGLVNICAELGVSLNEVGVIGNSMYDAGMLSIAGYSCAVLTSEEELKPRVKYIINPDHLPILFEKM